MQWITRELLNQVSREATASPRQRKNYNFHQSDNELCHRLLNAIEPGSYVPPHKHSEPEKSETMICVQGRLGVLLFDEEGRVTHQSVIAPLSETIGLHIPAGTYHSLVALTPGSIFFEAKGGPYVPAPPHEFAPWVGEPDVFYQKMLSYFG